ncbi:MAG: replication initiation protein RepC, partial [Acidocella sp.]|nr:replication initiation protein RepC [Acidocella sp.]
GGDKIATLNTDDLECSSDSVSALREEVVGSARDNTPASRGGKVNFGPIGRPKWIPKVHQVIDVCPTLATYLSTPHPQWSDLVDASYVLAARFELNDRAWKTLCGGLGREWAALTVAMVAELPAETFTRCAAPSIELRRASYIAGIARKMTAGKDVSITASWFRHVKRARPAGFSARH